MNIFIVLLSAVVIFGSGFILGANYMKKKINNTLTQLVSKMFASQNLGQDNDGNK